MSRPLGLSIKGTPCCQFGHVLEKVDTPYTRMKPVFKMDGTQYTKRNLIITQRNKICQSYGKSVKEDKHKCVNVTTLYCKTE